MFKSNECIVIIGIKCNSNANFHLLIFYSSSHLQGIYNTIKIKLSTCPVFIINGAYIYSKIGDCN